MYFTDDSLFPENMQPTIITAAPFGPEWLPGDVEDLPVSFKDQVQAAVDCYNAGATMLHVHVRDPKTGQGSTNFDQYNELIGMLRNAVPKMILQVGGSISFAPHTDGAKAKWLDYDTRHMLTELNPKPDCVTVTTGTTLWDITQAFVAGDADGTHLDDPKVAAAWSGMVVDSTPAFYVEHLKRLSKNRIQPYFVPASVHQLEIIERLLRAGVYKGPLNLALCGYGGGTMGRNPFDWMEMLRRTPHGRVERHLLEQHARQHRDPDNGDRSSALTCASATKTTSGTCTRSAGPPSSKSNGLSSRASSSAARSRPATKRARS